jgi:hypothetical protein
MRTISLAVVLAAAGLHLSFAVLSAGNSEPSLAQTAQHHDISGGRLQVVSNFLYVAASCSGFQVLEISDPARPTWVGGWRHPGNWCVRSVYAVGEYAYLASHFAGLQILDVRDPRMPSAVGSTATGGDTTGVHVVRRYAYLAESRGGLQVVDVGDPAKPVHIGGCPTSFPAEAVQAVGGFAYVACGPEGLQVFDVSVPTKPFLVGKYAPYPIGAHTLQILGNRAYIASFSSRKLCILDVTNLGTPLILGTCELGGYSQGIYADGQRVYASTFISSSGLTIVDITVPEQPQVLGTCSTSEWIYEVRVSGNYAYLMDRHYNIRILDVSDPRNPTQIGSFPSSQYASSVLTFKRPEPSTGVKPSASEATRVPIVDTTAAITNAPPELSHPHTSAQGEFSFALAGVPHATYVIQASTDLTSWTAITTNVLPATGALRITDLQAAEFSQRYYRAVKQH